MESNTNNQTTESAAQNTEGAAQDSQNNQDNNQNSGNAQSTAGNGAKTYTQAELDALIEKRLARERKKYQQNTTTQNQSEGTESQSAQQTQNSVNVDVTEDARQQAAAIIAQANQRLIQAIAQSEAAKLNINPNYVADAVRLADLSTVKVNDDGTVDSKSITAALEAVLERVPVLKATTESSSGGFKVGGEGNNKGTNGWNSKSQTSGDTKRWNKNRY